MAKLVIIQSHPFPESNIIHRQALGKSLNLFEYYTLASGTPVLAPKNDLKRQRLSCKIMLRIGRRSDYLYPSCVIGYEHESTWHLDKSEDYEQQ